MEAGFTETGITVNEFDLFADLTVELNTPAIRDVILTVTTMQETATEDFGTVMIIQILCRIEVDVDNLH